MNPPINKEYTIAALADQTSPPVWRIWTESRKIASLALAVVIATLLASPSAHAISATWSAIPTSGDWVAGALDINWSAGPGAYPGATTGLTNTDTATFSTSSGTVVAINDGSLNIGSITFGINGTTPSSFTVGATGGNSLFLSSGGTISIASGITGASTTQTVNASVVLAPATSSTAGSYTFSNNASTSTNVLNFGGGISGGMTSFGDSATPGITLTLSGANTGSNTISGVIANGGATNGVAVTKNGAGTWILGGANTYSGATTISNGTLNAGGAGALGGTSVITVNSGGTLLLSNSGTTDHINNNATVALSGGTFNSGGLSEGSTGSSGLGALALQADSVIDLGSGSTNSILHFAASNGAAWAADLTLTINNWDGATIGGGAEQLLFGTSSSALTAAQIAETQFVNPNGLAPGTYAAMILSNGEIVPVTEPSTWLAGAVAALALLSSKRRQLFGLLHRCGLASKATR